MTELEAGEWIVELRFRVSAADPVEAMRSAFAQLSRTPERLPTHARIGSGRNLDGTEHPGDEWEPIIVMAGGPFDPSKQVPL